MRFLPLLFLLLTGCGGMPPNVLEALARGADNMAHPDRGETRCVSESTASGRVYTRCR
jgi:hypothetical protein